MERQSDRRPRQARSQARVERMLDAAAALITRVGVEGLTMADVGAASGSAPGSLYQFFPNRVALISALAEREAALVERCVADALRQWETAAEATPATLIDAILPPLLDIYQSRPAWGELLHALARDARPGAIEQRLDARIEHLLSVAIRRLNPAAASNTCELASAVLLDLGHAGLLLARNGPAPVQIEVRRALVAYLEAWRAAD